MKQLEYHGILLDLEFKDPSFPESLDVYAKRKSTNNPWILFGVKINNKEIDKVVTETQKNMKSDKPYYAHFYNDEELIVVFREKVLRVKPHKSTWKPIIRYGRKINIPEEQLDFWPNRFQDEIHYFKPEDYIH